MTESCMEGSFLRISRVERALGIDGESSASQKLAVCLTSRDICFVQGRSMYC